MDEQTRARRDRCDTFVHGDGPTPPAELLSSVPADVVPDVYGEGGVVADLEAHVAGLLGFPAAVYLPSGTMAQGATLRVHAEARGPPHPALAPGLPPRDPRGARPTPGCTGSSAARSASATGSSPSRTSRRSPSRWPPSSSSSPSATSVAPLPSWDDLAAQVGWARDHGAAAHLDGARLWEAAAGYGRSPAEVAALFDTAYVSFYKGVGALPGCCVAGPPEVVEQVREWRRRLGGTLHALWPGAASALSLLPARLAEMPRRLEHARAVAEALRAVPGVRVVPRVPQTAMMHLLLAVDSDRFETNSRRLAEEDGVWTWPRAGRTGDPDVVRTELSVGRATLALEPARVAELVAALVR